VLLLLLVLQHLVMSAQSESLLHVVVGHDVVVLTT
jgi:hypothetical protein